MKGIFTLCFLVGTNLVVYCQLFVKHDATGTNDGTSWTNAFTTIQDALDIAAPGSEIWISAGTYVPDGPSPEARHFWVKEPLHIYGGFAGTESSPDQRDLLNHHTILSGDVNQDDIPFDFFNKRLDNAHHIMIIDSSADETILDGLIFENGATRIDAFMPSEEDNYINRWAGGGLYINRCDTKINNCAFRGNHAYRGAGLYALGSAPSENTIIIENSIFESNSALFGGGGASLNHYTNLQSTSCQVRDNASGTWGGGLFIAHSNLTVTGVNFSNNFSANGGAIANWHNAVSLIDRTNLILSGCSFSQNQANNGGAVIFNNWDRSFGFHVMYCTFKDNEGSINGGGIFIRDYADDKTDEPKNLVRIDSTDFISNTALYGGGVALYTDDDSVQLSILKSRFIKNSTLSEGAGGAMCVLNAGNALFYTEVKRTLFDSNVAMNQAGAICIENSLNNKHHYFDIEQCEFRHNFAKVVGAAIWSATYNDIGSIGSIRNSHFTGNQALGASGALDIYKGELTIEDCSFAENYTEGGLAPDYNGGGAITLASVNKARILRSRFQNNISEQEGGAILIHGGKDIVFENILFEGNQGAGTISNHGQISLINSTLIGNESGLLTYDSSSILLQNSIFANSIENLYTIGTIEIISNGGNISSDETMISYLTGVGNFNDYNSMNPELGPDHFPLPGSPAIDNGNPDGITSAYDLAGNPRIMGTAIDIGSYESFAVATKEARWNDPAIALFPNPACEFFELTLTEEMTDFVSLSVYDAVGQINFRTEIQDPGRIRINISDLLPGSYFVVLKSADSTYANSFVVQR